MTNQNQTTGAEVLELLPCPFCGSDARFSSGSHQYTGHKYFVFCYGCEASNQGSGKEGAAKAWNTRAQPSDNTADTSQTFTAEDFKIALKSYRGLIYGGGISEDGVGHRHLKGTILFPDHAAIVAALIAAQQITEIMRLVRELVEAREKATDGPWVAHANRVENDKEHGWVNDGWAICEVCPGTDQDENRDFIALSANHAMKLKELLK